MKNGADGGVSGNKIEYFAQGRIFVAFAVRTISCRFLVIFFRLHAIIEMSHTILLVQPGRKPEGRTYSDYESVNECLEGICKIYEEYLKRNNPNSPSITYDISQLFDFIDTLADLSCLVFNKSTGMYIPHNKDWIKEKIYILLRKQAGK